MVIFSYFVFQTKEENLWKMIAILKKYVSAMTENLDFGSTRKAKELHKGIHEAVMLSSQNIETV